MTLLALLPLLVLSAEPAAPKPAEAKAPQELVDRVAAVVNGDVIMLSEVTELAGSEWLRVQALPDGPEKDRDRAEMISKAFEMVLSDRLLSQAAVKDGVEANDQQVDAAIEDVKTRNRLDQAQLEEALRTQGIDMASYRAQTKRTLDAMLVLQERVRNRVKIGEQDLKNYYQAHAQEFAGEPEIHVRHIVLPLPENPPPEVEKKVRAEGERIRARITAGADFAAEAKRTSKGPSAAEGGELGWVKKGTIEAVDELIFALEPGQMSEWVRVGNGIHLFKVEEKRLAGGQTFEEAKEEVRNRLYQQQVEGFRAQIIAELKKEAVIEPKLPELASLAKESKAASKLK